MKNKLGRNRFWKSSILILLLLTAAFGLWRISTKYESSAIAADVAQSQIQKTYWTCPMHHQIHKDKPGHCPICGMTLVKVEDDSPEVSESSGMPDDHAPVKLSLERQQMIGVKFGKVERKPLFKTIRASGRVAFDPELYTSQNEYQEAVRQVERVKDSNLPEVKHSAERMLQSSKLRLKIMGLSDKQIAALNNKSVESDQNLLLHSAGQDVYIYAEVYEMDLPDVKPGLEADLSASFLGGRNLKGKVASVDRVLNVSSRTAKVRILVPKAKAQLRPESYVSVSILSPLGEQTTVPFDAVLETGTQDWVFVNKGNGILEPRRIMIKYRAGDEMAVESGVSPGDQIVTSANFLIDSESRLKAEAAPGQSEGAPLRKAPSCPKGQHWDNPMSMCMPGES